MNVLLVTHKMIICVKYDAIFVDFLCDGILLMEKISFLKPSLFEKKLCFKTVILARDLLNLRAVALGMSSDCHARNCTCNSRYYNQSN